MSGFNAKRIGNTSQTNYVIGLGRNRSAIASITREYNYLARTNQAPFCSLFDFNCSSVPSAPIIISTTPFSTSIEINFIQPSNGRSAILNYEYSLDSGSSWTSFSPSVTSTPISITGLTSGQTYNINIRAVNVIGASDASNTATQRTLSVPEEPIDLSAIPGDTSIEISFTEPYDGGSPITNYQYSLNGGTSWIPFIPIDTTSSVTINGLTNGTVYNIKLRAINIVGAGTASSQINIAPIPSNSFDPADISGINLWLDGQYPSSVVISDSNVTSWNDKSTEANNFEYGGTGTITYSQPSGINNRPAIYFETAPSTYLSRTFNIAPSTNQLSLFMVVYQVSNVSGNSELFFSRTGPTSPAYAYFDLFSNTNSTGLLSINIGNQTQVSTGVNIRGTIALIDMIATSTADIYVNGTQTNNNIVRGTLSLDNVIGWAISGGAFQGYVGEIVTYPSGLSDSDRQKVEGYLAWKWGLQSNLPNSQPYKNAPPISLDAPVITGITGASQALSVAFTQVTGGLTITNYQYSTDNGATFRELTIPDITSPLSIITLSSDGTTLLTNGVTYDVIIQAKTANGLGSLSNMVQGTPTSISPPFAPIITSATPLATRIKINFSQPSDGGSAILNYEYSLNSGSSWIAFSPSITTSPVYITGLTTGQTYNVNIRAVNAIGASNASNTITETTVETTERATFTSVGSTTWTVPEYVETVEYLVVGGGGGSGGGFDTGGGGGGGSGMVLTGTLPVTGGLGYSVTVGNGGAGGISLRGPPSSETNGSPGENSIFASITAYGGGGGYASRQTSGISSAGGISVSGTASTDASTGGSGGGSAGDGNGAGGGGGGNTSNGGDGVTNTGGNGGAGISNSISGTSLTYGIGGRGANGNVTTGNAAVAGEPNTGNGARGGGTASSAQTNGAQGGSGIVILKYSY